MRLSCDLCITKILHAFLMMPIVFMASCSNNNEKEPAGSGAQRTRQVPVEVQVTSSRLLINEIFTTGSLQANERVELRSEVSGRIISISFEEGSNVQKGQLLIKINDQDLQAQLKKTNIQSKLAEQEEYRKRKLLEIKAISQEEYDVAHNQLQSIRAEISLIMAQIAKTEIRAPFSGKIGLRMVSPGSFIPANTLIATLQQLDPIKIEFSVPEKYSLQVQSGMKIQFTIDNAEQGNEAVVYAVESAIDTDTRTIRARASCPNPKGIYLPGTYAGIRIILGEIPNAITIPSEAIITELEGNRVFLVRNGKATSVKVETGLRTSSEVQITEGLQPGDSLIVAGIMQVSEGSDVLVKKVEVSEVTPKVNGL